MRKAALALVTTATIFAVAACGETGSQSTQQPEERDPQSNLVKVDATEYSYAMPDEVTGGVVTLELSNTGAQPHEFAFVRLEEGKTTENLMAAFKQRKQPKWASDLAGVGVVSPQSSTAMVRALEEGSYAFFCFLPSPDGQPHIAHGMIQGFEVTGTSDAKLAESDFVVTATDDGFEVPDIGAGRHTVEFRNEGTKPHEFAVVSFEPGKGEEDLGRWFNSGYKGDAPGLFPGGIQAIEPGSQVVMDLEFVSGRTYTFENFENRLSAEVTIPEQRESPSPSPVWWGVVIAI